jgi:hypothetical protein
MNDTNPNDLSRLIDQAENQVSQQAARSAKASRKPGPSLFKPVMMALLAGLTVYAVFAIWTRLAPPGPAAITHDLEVVLERARDAVESAKKETGEYPDALPNASLASVVSYNHETDNYQLSATIMGIRVTLEPGGKKQIEKGVQ